MPQQCVTVRAVPNLWLESVPRESGTPAPKSSAVSGPVHFYSEVKCTHKAQKVHGKSFQGRDI